MDREDRSYGDFEFINIQKFDILSLFYSLVKNFIVINKEFFELFAILLSILAKYGLIVTGYKYNINNEELSCRFITTFFILIVLFFFL